MRLRKKVWGHKTQQIRDNASYKRGRAVWLDAHGTAWRHVRPRVVRRRARRGPAVARVGRTLGVVRAARIARRGIIRRRGNAS